jgi:GH18 family chitinase
LDSLHGIWDSNNPIGSYVYGHTNITEMKEAFDLYWRNDVPPAKLNMGIGFYGRAYELADPACNTPGCLFKGGAAAGTVGYIVHSVCDILLMTSISVQESQASCHTAKFKTLSRKRTWNQLMTGLQKQNI